MIQCLYNFASLSSTNMTERMQQESSEVEGENPTLLHWFWDFHHNNSSTSNWDYCHSSLEWEGGPQSLMSFWKRKNKSQTKLSTATLLSVASFATWCNPFPVVAVSLPSRSLWPVWCFLGRRWYVCIIRSPESKERNKNSSNIVLIKKTKTRYLMYTGNCIA